MKGNNGQAAKKRMLHRFMIGGGVCLICIGALALVSTGLVAGNGGTSRQLLRSDNVERVKEGVHKLQDKARKFRNDLHKQHHEDFNEAEMIEKILEAEIHLVSLGLNEEELSRSHPSSYAGVYGHFCKLNFAAHKKDPAAVPMFRDLVSHSPDCDIEDVFKIDLKKIAELARHRDQIAVENEEPIPKVLNLTTVAFHESRCGSTLVANALLAMDPAKHRTYSESQPGSQALKSTCGDNYNRCTVDQAAAILKDTVYMMSRSNDPQEERVFFKFQSITTKNIEVFQKAFPQVPWLFVYRDPVQVMMSHIKDDPTLKYAKCVQTQSHHPPKDIKQIAKSHGRDAKTMAREEYCAAHLAAISEAAVHRLNDYAIPMNYDGLIQHLYEDVLPRIWGRALTSTETANIQKVSQTYSKGRGKRHVDFKGDSEAKEHAASDAVKEAAALILKPSYDTLESFQPKLMERDLPVATS
ncbi:unnamed protein product [Cylindrotheca closterium]|uniref:Uncharacterized protein n=1 Tax=Cylindrotheca closterium TaxID=2856 RepID=A0AAD2G6H3_9STRA|nr:unnamed protein product [Cylindrotheca closterium]